MKYDKIVKGTFISRPNRFIAKVEIDGVEETVHVKNTGRCKELLQPGVTVYLEDVNKPERKTRYDLIGVVKGERLINMDSQAPNKAVGEFLRQGGLSRAFTMVLSEKKYGDSRFDFYIEEHESKGFLEVKGVTLEEDGVVRFPDAPTLRGLKHIYELIACKEEGYEAIIFFLVQMKGVKYFEPNDKTQPEFRQALLDAREKGVEILCYDSIITEDSMIVCDPVEVRL